MFRDLGEIKDSELSVGHHQVLNEEHSTLGGTNEICWLYHEEDWNMNWYLLCYEDIRFDWEPTTAQIVIVKQKLNP